MKITWAVCLLCLLIGSLGTLAWGGFSDRLVGKEKPAAGQTSSGSESVPESKSVGKGREGLSPSQLENSPVPSSVAPPAFPKNGSVGVLDILGLTLGMTQEEAIGAVKSRTRELAGKPISFEVVKEELHEVLVKGAQPRTKFIVLSDAKSVLHAFGLSEEPSRNPSDGRDPRIQQFAAGGQMDIYEFQFPNIPNDARVSSVTRVQRLAPAVHLDTIKAALVSKYGPPTIDGTLTLVWLKDPSGSPIGDNNLAKCRGVVPPPGSPAGAFDYSILAMKGCGEQLTVQLRGTPQAVMLIQSTLFDHQRLVEEREATQKAILSQYGLAPEQTKKAPAPQF
jgi:hypothetical protein